MKEMKRKKKMLLHRSCLILMWLEKKKHFLKKCLKRMKKKPKI